MTTKIAIIAAMATLGACGGEQQPEFATAFQDLDENRLEIRLGKVPELSGDQCNRNLYAGFRSNSEETIKLTLELVMAPDGGSMQKYERELLLDSTSDDSLIAGQTPLFPDVVEQPCREVHLNMLSMSCSYATKSAARNCPGSVRWQWLQGFKMVETPKAR